MSGLVGAERKATRAEEHSRQKCQHKDRQYELVFQVIKQDVRAILRDKLSVELGMVKRI